MILIIAILSCSKQRIPDAAWNVEITGIETTCVDSLEGYQDSFIYEAYFEGSSVELDISGQSFAVGQRRGCILEYTSATYLEESDNGSFRWNIQGAAESQTDAGGCPDIPDGKDWIGTETLMVVDSDNESIDSGCTYTMEVFGTYLNPDSIEYDECCKVCSSGKACGDTCISEDEICTKGRGCACDN